MQQSSKNIALILFFEFFSTLRFYDAVAIILFSGIAGNYTLGMAVFSVIAITAVIAELPTGILSDRVGRKNTIIFGSCCSLSGVTFFALAQSFVFLALGAVLIGIANAFYSGNNAAIIFETMKENNKLQEHHKIVGMQHSLGYIARALSALICATILFFDSLDIKILLWISIIPQILALILAFFITEPRIAAQPERSIRLHIMQALMLLKKNKKARLLAAAFIGDCSLGYVSYDMMTAFLNTIIPTWLIGVFEVALAVLGAIGSYISKSVIQVVGYLKGLVWGVWIVGCLRLLSALIGTLLSPVLFAFGQLFYSVTDVSQQHLLQMEYSDKERATIGSIISLLSGIIWAVASMLIGLLADMTSPKIALITVIVIWTFRAVLFKKSLTL